MTEDHLTRAHNNPASYLRDRGSGPSLRRRPPESLRSGLSRFLAPFGCWLSSHPVISSWHLKMPVTLYSDKFRSYEASSAPEYGPSPGERGGAGSGHGSRSKSLKGWAVIKKAIFTPIGTKDVSTHRRRRSRRNLHDPREQQQDEKINGIQSISSDQESEDAAPANNYKRKLNQKLASYLAPTLDWAWLLFIYSLIFNLNCISEPCKPLDWMSLGTFKSWVYLRLSREIIRVHIIITRPRHPLSESIRDTEATRSRPCHITLITAPAIPSISHNIRDKLD